MNNKIDFQLIEYPAGWKSIAAAWLTLFQQCSRPCGFYHPLFIEAAEVFPDQIAPTHVVLGYEGDVLVFGLPLRIENYWGLLKKITFFAGFYFAHLAPLDNTPGFKATRDFFAFVKSHYHLALIQGSNLDNEFNKFLLENIGAKNQFKIFSHPSWRSLCLSLPENHEDLLNNLTTKFRRSLRNHLNKAERSGIEFRILTSSQIGYNLSDAYDIMLRLKDARSEAIKRSSDYSIVTVMEKYYKLICKGADKLSDIVMFVEAIDRGKVIGSSFGFYAKNRFYGIWHGFLPQYANLSIGNLLIYNTMLALIDKKISICDLLGVESYKLQWTKTVDKDFNVLMSTNSFSSRAAFEWQCLQQSKETIGRLIWLKRRLLGKE